MATECSRCKRVLAEHQIQPALLGYATRVKAETRTPFYTFAFPMILCITIPTSHYFKYQHKQEVKEWAELQDKEA
jgi:hypothetical protein